MSIAEGASALDELPAVARRYLNHAIGPLAELADSVELELRGSILQKGRWFSFTAHERLEAGVGFHWAARLHWGPLMLAGVDQLRSGQASLDFRLFGRLPFLHASGPDVIRAAHGRLAIESLWLPSATHPDLGARWSVPEPTQPDRAEVRLAVDGEEAVVTMVVDPSGRLESAWVPRWGDPTESGSYGLHPFGGVLEDETTFDGYAIPGRLRAGWGYGTPAYRESFRFEITGASYSRAA
ncbi:MAG: hypothetical protein M0T75_10965 [Chloroflexi bacterium]|nr:hypothetical protein [Chloroflexota bacterium]